MTSEAVTPREQGSQLPWGSCSFQGPHLVTGKGLRSQEAEQEAQTIHEENVARLQAMAPEEILQEQQRLLAQLGTVPAFPAKTRLGRDSCLLRKAYCEGQAGYMNAFHSLLKLFLGGR